MTGENACGGGGVCYKDDTGSASIGSVTHGPHVSSEDGGVVVSYVAQRPQSQSCPEITTTLLLICTPNQVGQALGCGLVTIFYGNNHGDNLTENSDTRK